MARGETVSVERGSEVETVLAIGEHVRHEPPAFTVLTGETNVIELPAAITGLERIELRSDALGVLDPRRTGFVVSLPDEPQPAFAGLETQLFPQLYLRFLRRPGQMVPLDEDGQPAEVILPLLFDPGPYLALLGQDRHESGQFWRMPNDLATEKAAHLGGPFASQGTRFRVTR